MSDREQQLERLLAQHFEIEPSLKKIAVFSAPEDDELRLIEVNDDTLPTGKVQPFVFSPSQTEPWKVFVADVTTAEWERIRASQIQLPLGWPDTPLREIDRPSRAAG